MYVTCPGCHSLYSLTAEHLRLAGGKVRCNECQRVFDASSAVFDDPQQALEYGRDVEAGCLSETETVEAHGHADRSVQEPVPGAGADFIHEEVPATADVAAEDVVEEEIVLQSFAPLGDVADALVADAGGVGADVDLYAQPVAAEFRAAPSESPVPGEADVLHANLLLDEPPEAPRTAWGAIAAAFLLTLGLLAQYAYVSRYTLFDFPQVRPVLQWGCQYIECNLPLPRDLAHVEMIEREVRDHPNVDGALLINARFANRATFAQAYPTLQISFSDVSGTPVAMRRFRPAEYLSSGNAERGMQPGEQTVIMLEVVDPGETAVSFQFEFL